jgi:hypothetical protein
VTVGLDGQPLQVVLWSGMPGKADPTAGPIPACIIDTTDCRGDFDRLKARSVEFIEKEPIVYPNGASHANFSDPDGNRLALRQVAPAASSRGPRLGWRGPAALCSTSTSRMNAPWT